jgi:hypothetical protein
VANITNSMDAASQLPGAIAVGLMDSETGQCVAGCGIERLDLKAAAAGYTTALQAVLHILQSSSTDEEVHEIMLTNPHQVHLIRPMRAPEGMGLFLFLALERGDVNEALTRFKFAQIEQSLTL